MVKIQSSLFLDKIRPHHWNLARALAVLGIVSGATAGLSGAATLLLRVLDKTSRWADPTLGVALVSLVVGALAGVVAQVLNMQKERLSYRREWMRDLEQQLAAGPFEGRLPTLSELSDVQLGVTPTRYSKSGKDPYLRRVIVDATLAERLDGFAAPYPFVLVTGRAMSGKSRSLIHALRQRFSDDDPVVIIPRDGSALVQLSHVDVKVPTNGPPAVVVLDDLTSTTLSHLTASTLAKIRRFALIVASMPLNRYVEFIDSTSDITATVREVLGTAGDPVEVPFALTAEERVAAKRLYKNEEFPPKGSIAEVLVSGDRLVRKLRTGFDALREDKVNWAGQALVRAAIDCRRYGLNRPVKLAELRTLLAIYLADAPVNVTADDDSFQAGLGWATEPVESQVALLRFRPSGDSDPALEALPFAVGADDGLLDDQDRAAPALFVTTLLTMVDHEEAFDVSVSAYLRGDLAGSIAALQKSLEGPPTSRTAAAAFNLGVLREASDLTDEAADAFRLAASTDDADLAPRASLSLGNLLDRMGQAAGAQEAYQHAIDTQHLRFAAEAAFNLAGMLSRAGDLVGTEEKYRIAAQLGHGTLARKARAQLSLLAEMRTSQTRTARITAPPEQLLERTSVFGGLVVIDIDEEEQDRMTALNRLVHEREASREAPRQAFNIATKLAAESRAADAIEAYEIAIELGDAEFGPRSCYNLALLHHELGNPDEAVKYLRSALTWPDGKVAPFTLYNIGLLMERLGEAMAAGEACRRILASAQRNEVRKIAARSAALLHRIGQDDDACRAYTVAMRSPDEQTRLRGAIGLGIVKAKAGKLDEALSIWQNVRDSARDRFARMAAFNRALVFDSLGEIDEAIRELKFAVASTDATITQCANDILGQLVAEHNAN